MFDLPIKLLKSELNAQLIRGLILRTKLLFENIPHFKRLILLNNDFSRDDILYILTTSKVNFFRKSQDYPGIKNHFLYIQKGQTEFNQKEDMVIDCRRIDAIKKEKVLQNYSENKLIFLGLIPKQILSDIDKIIKNSILISPKLKNLVL